MNTTKAYIVLRHIPYGYSLGGSPEKVFFSKMDAEFYVWSENNKIRNTQFSVYSHYYSLSEVTVATAVADDKLFKKFVAEKAKKLDKEIAEKRACANRDEESIEKLEAEKGEYTKLV